MVVHEVAQDLGWHQVTVNVPLPSEKGKGKGKQKGKFKGKGKGKIARQVTVTHKEASPVLQQDMNAEVNKALEELMQDHSLHEHPFEWADQCHPEGERKRRTIREAPCTNQGRVLDKMETSIVI